MVAIRWSQPELDDLEDITRYIARDSPKNAASFVNGMIEMAEHLAESPMIGRRVRESDDRSLREFIYRKYRIIYQTSEDFVEIVRVIHGSRSFSIK
jgi:plasmid stabilization system protein ParE